jgi:hypothetical protein
MIKKIAPIILLSSCSYISYGELPGLISQSITGVDDIPITADLISQQQYSFAKFKMGKSVVAITVLAEIDDDVYLWVSKDREKIYTKHGKIIETVGLAHDMRILDSQKIEQWDFKGSRNTLVQLTNPMAIISQDITITKQPISNLIKTSNLSSGSLEFHENFSTPKLSWSGTNKFVIGANGLPEKAEQYIHPKLPKIEMSFFYK